MTTILVIEDETAIREGVVTILRFEDFNVLEAQNGQQGVELACQHEPDLIICDIAMPELNGYEVLQILHNIPNTRLIPFIFLTAKAQMADVRKGMSLGADDYLVKPFEAHELLHAIRTRLQRQEIIMQEYESALHSLQKSLVRMVTHELRTPLISLKMVEEIISRQTTTLSPSELHEYLGMISAGTRRMSHVVEQMVMMTEIEANTITAALNDPDETLAWEFLMAAVNLGRKFSSRNENLHVRLDARDGNISIACHLPSLKHACAELIANAINFSPSDQEVLINQWYADGHLWITIIDAGQGMEQEAIQQAIEAFKQIDRHKNEQQGLGLGLAIAYKVIQFHKGKLAIESRVGKGTQVTLNLPIKHGDAKN